MSRAVRRCCRASLRRRSSAENWGDGSGSGSSVGATTGLPPVGETAGLLAVGWGLISSDFIWDCIHKLPAAQPIPPAATINTNTRRIFPNKPDDRSPADLGPAAPAAAGGGGVGN